MSSHQWWKVPPLCLTIFISLQIRLEFGALHPFSFLSSSSHSLQKKQIRNRKKSLLSQASSLYLISTVYSMMWISPSWMCDASLFYSLPWQPASSQLPNLRIIHMFTCWAFCFNKFKRTQTENTLNHTLMFDATKMLSFSLYIYDYLLGEISFVFKINSK